MSLSLIMPEKENITRNSSTIGSPNKPSPIHGKQTARSTNGQAYLNVPFDPSARPSLESYSDFSTHSVDHHNENEGSAELLSTPGGARLRSKSPVLERSRRRRLKDFWAGNKGLMLVILAQLFGALMSVTTRLLETDGKHGRGMHPFQVAAIVTCTTWAIAKLDL